MLRKLFSLRIEKNVASQLDMPSARYVANATRYLASPIDMFAVANVNEAFLHSVEKQNYNKLLFERSEKSFLN